MNTEDQIEKLVFAYCKRHQMLEAGDRVVAGVSGGADSVCLLFLLRAFREKIPFELKVVHVHHGIRPEAGEDAQYVKSLCEQAGLPYHQINADVPRMARQEGLSEEEAGRKVRYQAFFEVAEAWQQEAPGDMAPHQIKIALAHHMGDRAETLLFHLFRGSGLKGLGSILPLRKTEEGYRIMRPLLCLERDQIEDYLAGRGISYCQDRTNFEDTYARNRIRRHVIPYAEEEICQGAVRHLNEAAELLAEAEDYLEMQTVSAYAQCVTEGLAEKSRKERPDALERRICATDFQSLPAILQKRMLLKVLRELSPGQKDIGAVHVNAVLDLFTGESGRQRNLPFGIIASREYGTVKLRRNLTAEGEEEISVAAKIPGDLIPDGKTHCIQWGKDRFEFQVFPYEKNEIIPEKNYTKWFDYDKIKGTLFLRTRRQGDYFLIRGGDGRPVRKTIKDYFITQKIPREQRDAMPLLADGDHILWIVGHRISEAYKIDENTKRILEVRANEARRA